MQINEKIAFFILIPISISLFFLSLGIGSVEIPFTEILDILGGSKAEKKSWALIIESRLSESLTACFAGMGLSIAGLMMQNIFQNPLAGPGVLGIGSGANLGVAISFLFFGSQSNIGWISVIASIIGSLIVLALIVGVQLRVQNNVMVLISGLMLSYLCGAGVNIVLNFSDKNQVQQFVHWGFGNFSNVDYATILWLLPIIFLIIFIMYFFSKSWNALLLGDDMAKNLGISVFQYKLIGILGAGIITGIVTAYCGPIAFIGIAVPHISRIILKRNNYFIAFPLTLIVGICICLIGLIFTKYPFPLPLNAVTSLIGAPVILWILIQKNAGWKM